MSQDVADFLMFTLVVSIIVFVALGAVYGLFWVFAALDFPSWLVGIIAVVSVSAIFGAITTWGS